MKTLVTLLVVVACLVLAPPTLTAQPVVAEGLLSPTGMALTPARNLLVVEAGLEPNTGRVSLVDRDGGWTPLLSGLPSGLDVEGSPSGPSAIEVVGSSRAFLAIGGGDVAVFGEAPGTEVPNPEGLSSPIFSSVLRLDADRPFDRSAGGFEMTTEHQILLAHGFPAKLRNAAGERLALRLVEDLRDLTPDPFTIVRASNPFSMVRHAGMLYLADAGQNALLEMNPHTGQTRTVVLFPPIVNPLPIGAPVVDPVPTSVAHSPIHGLVATMFTGFPFPPEASQVRRVGLGAYTDEVLVGGLTNAIDVIAVTRAGGQADDLYVLEFSSDLLTGAPGRLLRFESTAAPGEVVADGLITPTSVVHDPVSGQLYVSEIFTGRVLRFSSP